MNSVKHFKHGKEILFSKCDAKIVNALSEKKITNIRYPPKNMGIRQCMFAKVEELDLPEDPCNPRPDYNFYVCVRNAISNQVVHPINGHMKTPPISLDKVC